MPIHARQYGFAFSLNKQADIFTPIANAQINKLRPIRNYAPVLERKTRISDKAWYGKGHPHATFASQISKWYELRAQERSATSLEALYALALIMGNVSSTQLDAGTNPDEWTHTLTFQDTAVNKEVLYTTFGENFPTLEKLLYSGAWLEQVTFTGNREDHVTISFSGGARKQEVGVYDMPVVTESSFLHTLFGTVWFGEQASLIDVSCEILSWNLTVSQNPSMWNLMCNPDHKDLVSRVYIGDQSYSGQIVLFIDKKYRDLFRNDEICSISIAAKSPDLINTNQHSVVFTLHDFKISEEDLAEEGTMMTYVVNFSEETTLKDPSRAYLTAVITTDVDNTEVLVAA